MVTFNEWFLHVSSRLLTSLSRFQSQGWPRCCKWSWTSRTAPWNVYISLVTESISKTQNQCEVSIVSATFLLVLCFLNGQRPSIVQKWHSTVTWKERNPLIIYTVRRRLTEPQIVYAKQQNIPWMRNVLWVSARDNDDAYADCSLYCCDSKLYGHSKHIYAIGIIVLSGYRRRMHDPSVED